MTEAEERGRGGESMVVAGLDGADVPATERAAIATDRAEEEKEANRERGAKDVSKKKQCQDDAEEQEERKKAGDEGHAEREDEEENKRGEQDNAQVLHGSEEREGGRGGEEETDGGEDEEDRRKNTEEEKKEDRGRERNNFEDVLKTSSDSKKKMDKSRKDSADAAGGARVPQISLLTEDGDSDYVHLSLALGEESGEEKEGQAPASSLSSFDLGTLSASLNRALEKPDDECSLSGSSLPASSSSCSLSPPPLLVRSVSPNTVKNAFLASENWYRGINAATSMLAHATMAAQMLNGEGRRGGGEEEKKASPQSADGAASGLASLGIPGREDKEDNQLPSSLLPALSHTDVSTLQKSFFGEKDQAGGGKASGGGGFFGGGGRAGEGEDGEEKQPIFCPICKGMYNELPDGGPGDGLAWIGCDCKSIP